VQEQSEILFNEIEQLVNQYKVEVPGRRRAWPVSIKTRAMELCGGDLSYHEIAKRTGIPYHTLLTWRYQDKQAKSFTEVTIKKSEIKSLPTVTVGRSKKISKPSPPLTVTVGKGISVEGLDVAGAIEIIKFLGGQGVY
jgi:Transposase